MKLKTPRKILICPGMTEFELLHKQAKEPVELKSAWYLLTVKLGSNPQRKDLN